MLLLNDYPTVQKMGCLVTKGEIIHDHTLKSFLFTCADVIFSEGFFS